jgi:NAD(P)-dependent dehydrogenase (short-subunit alcohol dehydrogenase family)
MRQVKGKVAFITGGASGIGLGIAGAFVEAGMKVVVGDYNEEHLAQAMKCLEHANDRIHFIRLNVMDRNSMASAAKESEDVFGRIHVLVNNAGVQNTSGLSTMSYKDWDKLMGVNLNGIFNGVRAFLPRIRQHGEGGHVVTTASIFGLFTVSRGKNAAYCASKFAAVAMMESLRAELASSNIGVSVLCPGVVRTNLEEALKDFKGASEPREIGEWVLRGMRANQLYILTHPEFNVVVKTRSDAIIASSPNGYHPGDEREAIAQSLLRDSIYLQSS